MEFEYSDPASAVDAVVSYDRKYHFGSIDEWSDVVSMVGGDEAEVKNYVCDEFAEFAGEMIVSGPLGDVYAEQGQKSMRIQAESGDGASMLVRFDEFVFESLLVEFSFKDANSHKVECSLSFFVDGELAGGEDARVVGRGMQSVVQFFAVFFERFESEFCERVFTVDELQVV